jgi:protein-export membrane protein SecD
MAKQKNVAKTFTRTQVKWRVLGIAVIFLIGLFIVAPNIFNKGINSINDKIMLGLPNLPENNFNLGLDLQGGAHLVYLAKTDSIPPADRAGSVEGVRDVIERRVRGGLGVAEPNVQTTKVGDEYRVIVELPGVADVTEAINMIGETPVLEFKEENTEPPRDLTLEEQKELDDYNAQANKKIKEAQKELNEKVEFISLVSKYSEDEKSKKEGGNLGYINEYVYPEIYEWAKKNKIGAVTAKEIITTVDGLNLLKLLNEKDGEKRVTASHLLICYRGADLCDNNLTKEESLAKIEELKAKATEKNFTDLVKENSTEPGAAESGGDLGTFTRGQMIDSFEQAAFDGKVGEIIGPIETSYGYHLIYKQKEEIPKEYEVARIFVKTKSVTDILPPYDEWKFTGLTGKQLKKAEVLQDSRNGQIQVSLQFNDDGAKLFAEITTRNIGKPVAIFLDSEPISTPVVNEPIPDGNAVISGDFKWDEAKLLAQRLNSGALPVPVELISQQKVDATLGVDSLTSSFKAGLIGLILVILFMILYYRLPGLIAVFALFVYGALTLAIFKIIGVTLTLSGIAGFILSIGLAVDANILVFERLKEELRFGKSLRSATEEAFMRAWTSIRDGNITTLISCVFLIWMGTGFVQGFATTLFIGIIVSIFTAVIITRNLMRWVFGFFKSDQSNWMFLGHKRSEEESNK